VGTAPILRRAVARLQGAHSVIIAGVRIGVALPNYGPLAGPEVLARLEIRVMFEEILRRLPDIALTGPVERLRSNFINGIKRMPVRFTPERARLASA